MVIKTEIKINASSEVIWSILTDFEKYPEWNPFIKSLEGNVQEGSKIKVNIHPPDGKSMLFTPTVTSVKQNKELKWLGKFLIKGLFDGEHKFELIENSDKTTTLIQSEQFSGILVPLLSGILVKTKAGFELMNEELRKLSEKRSISNN